MVTSVVLPLLRGKKMRWGEFKSLFDTGQVSANCCSRYLIAPACHTPPPPPHPQHSPAEDSRCQTPFEEPAPAPAAAVAQSPVDELPAGFRAKMEQVRVVMMVAMMLEIKAVAAHIVIVIHFLQLLESKNLEIERLVNENAQLRLDLQRLREHSGE
jgi:hypothetical protein